MSRTHLAAFALMTFFLRGAMAEQVTDEVAPLEQAKFLYDTGKYGEAIDVLEAALEESPDEVKLTNALGEALFATGRIREAEGAFHRAMRESGPDRLPAELNLAISLHRRGQEPSARVRFQGFINVYNSRRDLSARELMMVGTAVRFLGERDPQLFHDAVRLYTEAAAEDPDDIDIKVALGELLLKKYNNTEAMEVFREALAIDSDDARALLGLARSQHFDHSSDAMETVNKSLAGNPGLVPARAFLARLYTELEDYDRAEAEAKQALAINPSSLDALAVLAAVHYLSGAETAFAETINKTLELNPRYPGVYNTVAELAARNRFYTDAVNFAQKALSIDSRSATAYALLGTNQLRTGNMEAGRANLDKAFEADPFNIWVKNMLDLADTFPEYDTAARDRFELFIHREESALLAPYVRALAEKAYTFYQERYDYAPKTPIRVELYPRHGDFSVRTVGLAGVGILGVSFGPVVAMDSPSARERGHFNWGSTLWHELAHTFHLGMTHNRVPRWLSEGLSVYEERQARKGWGGDLTLDFLEAYRDDKLLPVSELNNGFVRPSYPRQVIHSYYQASLVLEFIDARWGFAAIKRMLAGFEEGLSSSDVVRKALEMEPEALDLAFAIHLEERFGTARKAFTDPQELDNADTKDPLALAEANEGNYPLQIAAGLHFLEDDPERAEAFFLKAQSLIPAYAGDDGPYWYLAGLYERRGEKAKAAEQLTRMVAINAEHYHAHLKLAALRRELGQPRAAAEALESAIYIYPFEIPLHKRLAELYAELGDWPKAIGERQAVVALAPVDMAQARYQLANAHLQAGDSRAARREILRTLEIAPNFEKAQDLLLDIRARKQSAEPAGKKSES